MIKDNQSDYVELWYPILSDLTFKTWIFKFTLEEGILLHRVALQTFKKKPVEKNDQQLLDQFLSKVSDFFEKVKNESPPKSGYFLRLGSRSLKDAVFNTKYAMQRIIDLLHKKYMEEYKTLHLETKEEKIKWVNQKSQMTDVFYFAECDIKALKCYTISDMFELFFNSERIITDLSNEIKYESPKFSLNFRLWDDRLTYQMEFRGFVYHHKFCALTQYDNRIYYKKVYENKDIILHSIIDFFEDKVKPRMLSNCPMKDGSYVIDFGVVFNGDNDVDVIVIELNHFARTTGSSLFNWDRDFDVLTGEKEFEFRLVKENQYNDIDFDYVIDPMLINLKNKIKAQIVNDNKSFAEKHFTWIKKVEPKKY